MAVSRFAREIGAVLVIAVSVSVTRGQAFYATNGGEYRIAGALPGDQAHPQMALGSTGGYVVWEDNRTDGSGLGISGQRVDGSASGVYASFRVNQNGTNDQERPYVTLLKNGGAAFVWQGGKFGYQSIYARFLSKSNTWVTGDIRVNTYTNKSKYNPVVATLADGNVVVVWGSMNQRRTNSLQDIYFQRFSPSGTRLGTNIPVNQYSSYNQRTPAVVSLAGGRFVIAWVSEQQRSGAVDNPDPNFLYNTNQLPSVDIYARVFGTNGLPFGNEFVLNTTTNVCSNPVLAADANGGFMAAWAQKDVRQRNNGWDIYARPFSATGVGGTEVVVNATRYGDQYTPAIAANGTDYFVVWTDLGHDGSREGVFGRFLRGDGTPIGNDILVNTTTISRQIHPTVAADGRGRFIAAWSSFTGIANGMDLFAQRYTTDVAPLGAPDAPFISAISSNTLSLTWAAVGGYVVSAYQIYQDGATDPTASTTNNWLTISNLAPSSTHSFKLAYLVSDGRLSPLSATVYGKTYSGAATWGGIPQEWMTLYFGGDLLTWPSPYADSDGDGISNLNEFLAGTDPTDQNSALQFWLKPTSQGMFLNWNTEPGFIYQVQTSANMVTWSNVGGPRFASGVSDSVYVGTGVGAGYFRVLRVR